MKIPVGNFVFEIMDGKLIYRGCVVQGNIFGTVADGVTFGDTGITLTLFQGEPVFEVPAGHHAKMILSNHAYLDGVIEKLIKGRFVSVLIY